MKVCVVGAGTAGLFSSMTLKKKYPSVEVTVVSSSTIPTIKVGESTTAFINGFLFDFLSIDKSKFFKEVKPSFKLGARFFWGTKGVPYFDHQFDPIFSESISNGYALGDIYKRDGRPFNVGQYLMKENLSPYNKVTGEYVNHGLHLENEELINFLSEHAKGMGIQFVDAKVIGTQKEGDTVSSIQTTKGDINADFYINAGGFNSVLNTQNKINYDNLPCDTALVVTRARDSEEVKNYTGVHTMNCGWCWEIHHWDSIGNGYVFSSDHISEEDALAELREHVGFEFTEYRFIPFNGYRCSKFIEGNVGHVGNSYGFWEPLQAMTLGAIAQLSDILSDVIYNKGYESRVTTKYTNKNVAKTYDDYADWLQMHYHLNNHRDTEFWLDQRALKLSSKYEDSIELYKEKGSSAALIEIGLQEGEIEEFANVYTGCCQQEIIRDIEKDRIKDAETRVDNITRRFKNYEGVMVSFDKIRKR